MERKEEIVEPTNLFMRWSGLFRRFIFKVLAVGPIPNHIAFILDGNRRYAEKHNLKKQDMGHRAGFVSLLSVLKYCSELNVKYVTLYAFSIDNFKRRPEEVRYLMDLMLEKTELVLKENSYMNFYGARLVFLGDLNLLDERLKVVAEEAMRATAKNSEMVILVCVAYSTRHEIVHAVQESCERKHGDGFCGEIEVADVEECMYMAVAPEPELLIRTSKENRLSNFLVWQTRNCLLYSPAALWPEIGLRHLVWAIIKFQRTQPYLESKKKKQE